MCYRLLRLLEHRMRGTLIDCDLKDVLDPAGYTPDTLDFSVAVR